MYGDEQTLSRAPFVEVQLPSRNYDHPSFHADQCITRTRMPVQRDKVCMRSRLGPSPLAK
jgi:hypothetical protein